MKKLLSAITAALFAATGAFAANVGSVDIKSGTLSADGTTYTATALEYKASPSNDSAPYRTQTGWYAGIKLNWNSQTQNAKETKASVSDGDGMNKVTEYTVYNNGDKTPSGSGMKNEITTSGNIISRKYWMSTTEWYIYVTPEFMYSLNGADYSATLTIGGNPYTITVPNNIVLSDGSYQWYPAIAVVDGKVYGDMGLAVAAGATAAAAGKEMEFFVEPTGCPDGVSVVQDGDVWKLVVSGPTSIESVGITLSETEFIFDGEEHTVDVTAVMLGEVTLNKDVDYTVSGELSATNRGEYTVTVTGMGNFEGTATATWRISNTTGTGSSVSASVADSMTNVGNDFTLSDSSKLEYDAENAVWYAGITITWPMDKNDSWSASGGGYARYVSKDSVRVTYSDGLVSNAELSSKFRRSLTSGEKDFTYLSTTTWKVGITPEIIAAALDEGNTELVYTMTAGAFIWGNDTEGDPDGVRFQDYTITIPLDENLKLYDNYGNQAYPALPYVAQIDGKKYLSLAEALVDSANSKTIELIAQDDHVGEYEIPEGVTVALGSFGSASATYVLSVGAVLSSDAECTVSTRETGYGVERSGEGPYTYTVVMQHVHDWSVVAEGNILTATCVADTCPLYPTTYSMRLFTGVQSGATEDVDGKTYDGESMSRRAEFSDGFTDVFPNVETQISVAKGGESVDTINDAGEYVVTMIVTGVGNDEQSEYTLSRTVTVSPLDITGATLVLSPASKTYNGTEQSVTPSVAVDGVTATLNNGLEVVEGTCSATEIGTYSVKVNGIGNFEGELTGTWEIVNTTGAIGDVAPTADGFGEYDNENNTLTVTDTTALAYEGGAWSAGLALTWPIDEVDASIIPLRNGHAYYVKPDKMRLTLGETVIVGSELLGGPMEYADGVVTADVTSGDYWYLTTSGGVSLDNKNYTALSATTWKIRLTPAIIESAIADAKTELTYTMNAGAFVWGDDVEGDTDGVAFKDYTITIPLENVVFALAEGETHDLGDTMLTTTRIKLAPGASVTSSVEQTAEGAIYPADPTSYQIVCSEVDDKFVYTTQHIHNWNSVAVANNGYELVATCSNDGCDEPDGKVVMTLSIEDKIYDGTAITASAVYAEDFSDVFPDVDVQNVGAQISVTKDDETVDAIMDAGEYVVTMTVTGLENEQNYTLTRTVTVNPLNIENTTLVLEPLTQTYTGNELSVTPSVTVGGFTLTLGNGLEMIEGTCTATEIGEYTVTVYGTGNFTGTPPSATWEIVASSSELTIIEEIKADIADEVSGETAESAKAKIDILAGVAGDGNEQKVADWVDAQKGDNAAEFYTALAQSEYVKASFELDTALITADSDVSISEFVDAEDGFTLAVKIGDDDIEAVRVKATRIIMTATALDSTFAQLDAARIVIPESGVEGEVVEMTVTRDPTADGEFFKVVIPKDAAE